APLPAGQRFGRLNLALAGGEVRVRGGVLTQLLELGATHPAGRASIEHLGNVRAIVTQLAEEAGLRATESFTRSWHILMKGSIVCAAAGDAEAAKRAQAMAKLLIEQHR